MHKNSKDGGDVSFSVKTVLIDDEASALNTLKILLTEFCPEIEIVGEADSVQKGVNLIENLAPDLVFLDIEIIDGTGFDLLEQLGGFDFKVIFTTAYEHYALKAIKFSALDYLLKPIESKDLVEAVNKAVTHIEPSNTTITVNKETAKILIPYKDYFQVVKVAELVRCEAENNYTRLYLKNGKNILVSRTLKHFEHVFADFEFVRTHQSHLVNPEFVLYYFPGRGGSVKMEDGSVLPVSRNKKQDLLAKLDVFKGI